MPRLEYSRPPAVYYNEHEPYAAQWLRNLCDEGLLPEGEVDERSIQCVSGADLEHVTQAHFFAGIGGWPLALDLAGWPAEAEVFTGSCPCQPFSSAGRREGAADARHLWPDFYRIIEERRPAVVFGEQVGSPDGRAWLSAVRLDLESLGYTVGAADLPAAGVGAPHKRQRLYWVALAGGERLQELRLQLRGLADSDSSRSQERSIAAGRRRAVRNEGSTAAAGSAEARGLGDAASRECEDQQDCDGSAEQHERFESRAAGGGRSADRTARGAGASPGDAGAPWFSGGGLGDASSSRGQGNTGAVPRGERECPEKRFGAWRVPDKLVPAGATSGPWADADWWLGLDGKARPAQRAAQQVASGLPAGVVRSRTNSRRDEGTFPLVSDAENRPKRLKGYGNALCVPVAVTFVRAVMECL